MGEQPHTPGTRRGRVAGPASAVLTPPTGVPVAAPPARVRPPVAPPVAPPAGAAPCACGHARLAHEHYRRGTDCGACGAQECGRFRRRGGVVRRAARALGLIA